MTDTIDTSIYPTTNKTPAVSPSDVMNEASAIARIRAQNQYGSSNPLNQLGAAATYGNAQPNYPSANN